MDAQLTQHGQQLLGEDREPLPESLPLEEQQALARQEKAERRGYRRPVDRGRFQRRALDE